MRLLLRRVRRVQGLAFYGFRVTSLKLGSKASCSSFFVYRVRGFGISAASGSSVSSLAFRESGVSVWDVIRGAV